jgi:N6-adenosine-specific RNA methylase IME4
MTTGLALYDAACRAVAEAVAVDEVKEIRDQARAMQVYAEQAKNRSLIENATALRMRAERRIGELLHDMRERGERDSGKGNRNPVLKSQANTPKLSDLGVTKSQSSRWQRLADMDPSLFEARIDRAQRKAIGAIDGAGKRTRAELRAEDEARVAKLQPLLVRVFPTLLIDFPWEQDWLSDEARADPGYACMTIDQLFALPVPQWTADLCHLYFCTPNNFMPVACKAVEHFGFQHRNIITWKKPKWGRGQYFRNQTEQVIFATRGKLRTRSDSIPNYFEAPVGGHSEKPEKLYEIIRAASYPPYGEAFQRQARSDFINLFAEVTPPHPLDIPPYLRRAAP